MQLSYVSAVARLGRYLVPVLALAGAARADLLNGDILVNDFSENNIKQYRPNGDLVQTFTAPGAIEWEGASITPDGNVVTTYRQAITPAGAPVPRVAIFSPTGSLIRSFNIATSVPGDVSVFRDGILAVSDQTNHAILEYDQLGTFVRSVQPANAINPFGSTVSAADNTLWVADPTANSIYHLAEDGTDLGGLSVSDQYGNPITPADVVVDSNGNLFVTDRQSTVYHIATAGATPGQAFAAFDATNGTAPGGNGTTGIGLAPDGSVYVTGQFANDLFHINSLDGSFIGSFKLDQADPTFAEPLFISVVSVPEPGIAIVGGLLTLGLSLRRRR